MVQRMFVAMIVLGLVTGCAGDGSGSDRSGPLADKYEQASSGSAFTEGVRQGAGLFLDPGSFAVFGLVLLENGSDDDVTLLGAEPVRLDHAVDVQDILVVRQSSDVPGSDRDRHVPGARQLDGFIIAPSTGPDDVYTIIFELTVGDNATDPAALVGVDVYYRVGSQVMVQRWPVYFLLCSPTVVATDDVCGTYRGVPAEELDLDQMIEDGPQ